MNILHEASSHRSCTMVGHVPRDPALLPHLLGHHLNTQDAILCQEHVGLKGIQFGLGVQAVEVAAQRLSLQAGR